MQISTTPGVHKKEIGSLCMLQSLPIILLQTVLYRTSTVVSYLIVSRGSEKTPVKVGVKLPSLSEITECSS